MIQFINNSLLSESVSKTAIVIKTLSFSLCYEFDEVKCVVHRLIPLTSGVQHVYQTLLLLLLLLLLPLLLLLLLLISVIICISIIIITITTYFRCTRMGCTFVTLLENCPLCNSFHSLIFYQRAYWLPKNYDCF